MNARMPNSPLSPSEAARELLNRRKARKSLIEFTKYTLPQYIEAKHHTLIAQKLEAVERGEIDRLMINMPPRHGKSELASRRFPAWFLGRHPTKSIIAASYNSDLASDFGRQVRDIVSSGEYTPLFQTALAEDSRAANRWNTSQGGSYVAAGVGTAITGRGADVFLIDDPIKDRREADSETQRQTVWDWYTSTAYTRLAPGGRIIVIQCMTGETPVLMADGVEKPLRDIRPGDCVSTYDNGKISTSVIRNWVNHGPDRVYEIRMKSGIIVKANARHPFLVDLDGETKWVRTASLKKGSVILRVIGASGGVPHAPKMAATSPLSARGSATRTTVSKDGRKGFGHLPSILYQGAKRICDIATELACQSMSVFLPNKVEFAPFASNPLQRATPALIGATNFASITATIARRLEGFSVTTAIWQSATERLSKFSAPQRTTYEIGKDTVIEVIDAGVEDVFDIEVERTENFIANGLISHNTRWHEDDLSGKLLAEQARGGDKWDVLELPAINDDGEALWPDFYPIEALERIRTVLPARDWSALYQQRPAPDEGDYFKREWFKWYTVAPHHLRTYGASDYAVTAKGGDYTVHLVAGVDPDDNLYILDMWRSQAESHVWVEEFINLVQKHKPLNWGEEQGQIIKSLGPFIDKRMRERRVYCRREQMASGADKPTRCRSFQARAAMGKVYLPHNAPWVADLIGEMMNFPVGKHDDQVDALGLVGRMLDTMSSGRAVKTDAQPPSKWDAAFKRRAQEQTSTSWKGR